MSLSPQQRLRVEALLNDGDAAAGATDADLESAFETLFGQIESAEELHHLAANVNWDGGLDLLRRIVAHPLCDAGTALMLFWLGAPGYVYSDRAAIDPLPDHAENLAFLREIERKYVEDGFASRTIRVDPRDLYGSDEVAAYAAEGGMRRVDERMKEPSPGVPLPLDPVHAALR